MNIRLEAVGCGGGGPGISINQFTQISVDKICIVNKFSVSDILHWCVMSSDPGDKMMIVFRRLPIILYRFSWSQVKIQCMIIAVKTGILQWRCWFINRISHVVIKKIVLNTFYVVR